jgi:putative transposase
MKKVSGPQVITSVEASGMPLPAAVLEALGERVGAARDGLLAVSASVGLGVVHSLMEAEVDEVVGPIGKGTRIGRRSGTGTSAGR